MTPPNCSRPLPGCPARHGHGVDITTADFTLVAHDCLTGPDGRRTMTEIFGFFRLPGEERDDDIVLTAGFDVPIGLPIARLAHQVSCGRHYTQRAADMLRSHVTRWPCTPQPNARP